VGGGESCWQVPVVGKGQEVVVAMGESIGFGGGRGNDGDRKEWGQLARAGFVVMGSVF